MRKILNRYWIILSIFLCFIMSASANDTTNYYPADNWRTSSPEAQGMDSEKLVEMLDFIRTNNLKVHGVIVVRHGYIVLEAYAYPFRKDIIHALNSCTKIFTSAVVGIAIKEGFIKSIDQKIIDFFPERKIKNLDENKRSITIEHLLTKSTGIESLLYSNNWINFFKSSDWIQFYLDLPMAAQPGKKFNYDDAAGSILNTIVQKNSNMDVADFIKKFLLKPIGINNFLWQIDNPAVDTGERGLALTPIDMARFGYLYLKNGNWNGKQVIPADWVKASMSNHIDSSKSPVAISNDKGYGYLWWGLSFGGFTGHGSGGQFIMVMPERDLVVVFTSGFGPDWRRPLSLTEDYINKSIVSSSAIQVNPEKEAKLASAIKKLEHSTLNLNNKKSIIPEMARKISGKKFILDENPLSIKSLMLILNSKNECFFEQVIKQKNVKIAIGLNGKYIENKFESNARWRVLSKGKWINANTFQVEFFIPWLHSSKIIATSLFDNNKLKIIVESDEAGGRDELIGKME